jgi:hypothetical protein
MTKTWQLSMGVSDFDFIIEFLNTYDLPYPFKYEKGTANMKIVPEVNDEVFITCRAKLIAKGIILEKFHLSKSPQDTKEELYATILVQEIAYDQPYMKGRRRNWTQLN